MANKARKKTVSYETIINGNFTCSNCKNTLHYMDFLDSGWVRFDCEKCKTDYILKPIEYEIIT